MEFRNLRELKMMLLYSKTYGFWSKIIFPIIILFTPNFLIAQIGNIKTLNQGQVVNENFIDTLTFEWEWEKIIVPVQIGGKVWRFMLDTGACLVISKQLQKEMNYPSLGDQKVTDINEQSNQLNFVTVSELQLGEVKFQNIPGAVFSFQENIWECLQVDGFIGSNLLKDIIIDINLPEKQLILTDNIKFLDKPSKFATKMALTSFQSTPIITVRPFDKATEELVVDLGADDFYTLSDYNFKFFKERRNVDKYIIAEGVGASSIGLYGPEKTSRKYLLELPRFILNKTEFNNLQVATSQADASRIGSIALNYGSMTLDFLNKKFYFLPYEEEKSIDLNTKDLGFYFNLDTLPYRVGFIWNNSQAYKQGLRSGNPIVQIGNYSIENTELCETIAIIKNNKPNEGKAIQLTYLDQEGNRKNILIQQ